MPDAGVTLGVGEPAVEVGPFPDCSCDACDGGAQSDLEHLDSYLGSIIAGTYRRLKRGEREVVVVGEARMATGISRLDQLEKVLANRKG